MTEADIGITNGEVLRRVVFSISPAISSPHSEAQSCQELPGAVTRPLLETALTQEFQEILMTSASRALSRDDLGGQLTGKRRDGERQVRQNFNGSSSNQVLPPVVRLQ